MVLHGSFYGIFASHLGDYQLVPRLCKDYFAKGTYLEREGKKQKLSMINILPEELLIEILARLPVKSLLRFRSVSKSWMNILKEPTFITKHHLTQVALNRGNCVFVYYKYYKEDGNIGRNTFGLLTEDEQGINFTRLDLPFLKDNDIGMEHYDVAGPCNGIVLVCKRRYWLLEDNSLYLKYDGYDDFFLWNPATGEYRLLPPSGLVKPNAYCCVGFGIDPITNDFKVVRIWEISGNNGNGRCRAEIISLSATSCKPKSQSWRTINAPPDFPFSKTDQLYFNGNFYWCLKHSDFFYTSPGMRILWFDMEAEVFGFIKLPYLCSNPYWHRLGVLKGSLAMIKHAYMTEENKYMYEIWIMDGCDAVSWTKYATVGPFVKYQVPLGFWKDEEVVVSATIHKPAYRYFGRNRSIETHEVASYDIKTNMIKKRRQGLWVENSLALVLYNESLVSVVGEG